MNPKIARCTTIATALTIGWLTGMASMSISKADAPRFAELTPAQLDDQQRPIADRILKFSRIGIGGPYHIMLRSPKAAEQVINLMDYLRFQSTVPNRLKEFSIMIQGRLWRSQVEWATHYQPALKAGVSEETLAQLKTNMRPTSMQPDEAAVYDFCTELYTKHAVSDATYAAAVKRFGEKGVTDAIGLAGYYGITAMALAVAKATYPAGAEPKLENIAQVFPK